MSPGDSESDTTRAPPTPDSSPATDATDDRASSVTDRLSANDIAARVPGVVNELGDTTDVKAQQAPEPPDQTVDENLGDGTLDEVPAGAQSRRYLPLQAATPPMGVEEATDVVAPGERWRAETLDDEYTDVSTNPRHRHDGTGEITKDRTEVSGSVITDIRTGGMRVQYTSPEGVPSFSDADPHQLAFAETSILDDEDGESDDASESPPDALLGEVLLGRYRIEERIGRGGMATVYLAEHVTIGKEFAVKVLAPRLAESSVYVDRFLQEARAASMIRHPNVVDINDFGYTKDENLPFFVMELLEGEDLRETLERERRLSWGRARPLVLQICAALAAAHKAGVIHRDIKPENCFISQREDQRDVLKLLDFGIAKVTASDEPGILTAHGVVLGTVDYISPERSLNKPVDARADIYSLGVLLYRMMTGRPPFEGVSKIDVITAHVYEEPPPPNEIAPDAEIPAALEAVILKALAKEPDDRFQSAVELTAALEAIPVEDSADDEFPPEALETTPVVRYQTQDDDTGPTRQRVAPPLPALEARLNVARHFAPEKLPDEPDHGPDNEPDGSRTTRSKPRHSMPEDLEATTIPTRRGASHDPDPEHLWDDQSTGLTARSHRSSHGDAKHGWDNDTGFTELVSIDKKSAQRGGTGVVLYIGLALVLLGFGAYLVWMFALS